MAAVAGHRTFATGNDSKIDSTPMHGRIGGPFTPTKSPDFLQKRLDRFKQLLEKQQKELAAKPRVPVTITLPDGKQISGMSFEISPYDVALGISKGLAASAIIAKVAYDDLNDDSLSEKIVVADDVDHHTTTGDPEEWQLWDMKRPVEGSCRLKLLKFDDAEGQHVFWHSSAHILGECLETEYGAHLTIGPALQRGFYYDCYVGDMNFNQDVYSVIEQRAEQIFKENQEFFRVVISKEEALELFGDNPFKVELIKCKVPDGSKTTCYACGTLVDLCRGPHVPSTSYVKAFCVEKHSAAYWLGDPDNDHLQRIYGISFTDVKRLKEHKRMLEEAKKRDHRLLGNTLQLYFFDHNLSPGSAFWLPDGAKIYNKLCNLIRTEYRIRDFQEVISPNIYSSELFKVSGHYQNYHDNMFMFPVEGKAWGLKPMNCPGHCLLYRHINPSYRQLPLRLADFGVLHRNELSGSLSGLTRVRRFQQDDAHVFLRLDQVQEEVASALNFLFYIYDLMGFNFELMLSTRPKKALGDVKMWNVAETSLKDALNSVGVQWTLNEGDGAFYGPKIDVRLQDAIQRWHQCGTIQLDFQMPLRFNLHYRTEEVVHKSDEISTQHPHGPHHPQASAADKAKGEISGTLDSKHTDSEQTDLAAGLTKSVETDDVPTKDVTTWEHELKRGYERPVMVHRAILGSVERMCAVIVEHTAGKFPFWLSPRQAIVCPISEASNHYGSWVRRTLHDHGYDVSLDDSNRTVNKKVREAQLGQWNFILVVGAKEENEMTVTVRLRENPQDQKTMSMGELLEKFDKLNTPSSKPLYQVLPYEPRSKPDTP